MAETTAFIDIRESGNVIEVGADTLCTRDHEDYAVDRLKDGPNGHPLAYGDPWPNPVITLADCKVGEAVFAKLVGNDPKAWIACEVVSEVRSKREGSGDA